MNKVVYRVFDKVLTVNTSEGLNKKKVVSRKLVLEYLSKRKWWQPKLVEKSIGKFYKETIIRRSMVFNTFRSLVLSVSLSSLFLLFLLLHPMYWFLVGGVFILFFCASLGFFTIGDSVTFNKNNSQSTFLRLVSILDPTLYGNDNLYTVVEKIVDAVALVGERQEGRTKDLQQTYLIQLLKGVIEEEGPQDFGKIRSALTDFTKSLPPKKRPQKIPPRTEYAMLYALETETEVNNEMKEAE